MGSEFSRIDFPEYEKLAPEVVQSLITMAKAIGASGLDKSLIELIKIRAAQLNGCAYCLQLHLNMARKAGVAPAKIDLVATWREVGIFSARERAALAWSDALTLMCLHPVQNVIYQELEAQFTKREISVLTAAISNINAWNRIAGGLLFTSPIPPAGPST